MHGTLSNGIKININGENKNIFKENLMKRGICIVIFILFSLLLYSQDEDNSSTDYYSSGTFISPTIDFNDDNVKPNLTYISWSAYSPPGTNITLQTRVSLDGSSWNITDLFCPLWGFGNAVLLTRNVPFPEIKPVGSIFNIVLVIGSLVDPDVGDGQGQSGIGSGTRRYPFVSQNGGRVVTEWVNEDLLDPDPEAKVSRWPIPGLHRDPGSSRGRLTSGR